MRLVSATDRADVISLGSVEVTDGQVRHAHLAHVTELGMQRNEWLW